MGVFKLKTPGITPWWACGDNGLQLGSLALGHNPLGGSDALTQVKP